MKKLSPLEFARAIFEDERNPANLRLRAAREIVPYLQASIVPSDQHVSDEQRRTSEDAKLALGKARAFIDGRRS